MSQLPRRKRGISATNPNIEEPSTSRRSSRASDDSVDKFTAVMTEFLKRSSEQGPSSATVRGDVVPIFDPENNKMTISNWCQKVDELREIYNWSEEATIYYAMNKLRGLAEIWYKSLPTLKFSWEEWKDKLASGFPSQRNYCTDLQEMLNRKKRIEETYIKYYYEKVALLNGCKIFGEDAVSCIIGGISDMVVRTGASAGNHKTPESLYIYLSSVNHIPTSFKVSLSPSKFSSQQQNRFGNNTQKRNDHKKICYICKKPGHTSRVCRAQKPYTGDKKCSYCRRVGHLEETCYFKKTQRQEPKI